MSAPRHPSRRMRAAFGVLLALALAVAPSLVTAPAAAAPQHPTALAATYETAPCPVSVPLAHRESVRCGYLTVPERRGGDSDPERTLRLAVAIVPGGESASGPPLIVPGTLSSLPQFLDANWPAGDVILVEQRGQTHAEPALDCPELDLGHFIEDGALLTGDAATDRRLRQVQRCHERLLSEEIDLGAYTSAASAADIADLRAALGFDAWSLYGAAESSRIALTAIRDQSDGLAFVILDGPQPMQVNRYEALPTGVLSAVAELLSQCASETACHERYPDLGASLRSALARAAEEPAQIRVVSPVDRAPLRVELTDEEILETLLDALSDPDAVRTVPFVIDRLAHGHDDAIVPLVERRLAAFGSAPEGLLLSLDCAEELPFHDVAAVEEAWTVDPLLTHLDPGTSRWQECEIWEVPALGERENAAVTSSIPTLLLAGGLDPDAPPASAELTAEGLTAHEILALPQRGAGILTPHADTCAASVAWAYVRDPATSPSPPCLLRTKEIGFLTDDEVHAAPAVHGLDADLRHDPLRLAFAGILLVTLLAAVGYGVAYGLTWLARRRGSAPEGAMLAASISAGANVAYALALLLLLARVDPLVLDLGVPAGAWPLVILPFVALAAAVVLVVLLVRAWRGGDGSMGHRIALSLVALASLAFTVWLVARGLLIL